MGDTARDKTAIVAEVCRHVVDGQLGLAQRLLQAEYPFATEQRANRRYTHLQKTRVFARDGFIDRYSGDRRQSQTKLNADKWTPEIVPSGCFG